MGTGTLTLACVLLTAGAGAEPETYHINRPKMAIPIEIVPARRNDLREILLFCSRDEGKTWTQEGRATPEQTSFPFTAPADGKYWFTIQTVDRNGARDPVDVYAAPVGQRVVVDTVKPLVRVKAERKGDEIVASWEVTEDYPKPSTFVPRIASIWLQSKSPRSPRRITPALLIRISTGPRSRPACSTIARTWAASPMCAWTAMAFPPRNSISRTRDSASAARSR